VIAQEPAPRVSYVLAGGTLRITPDGAEPFLSEEEAGAVHWSERLGRHEAENVGETMVRILLVEVKAAAVSPRAP
jgi:hypothetical protein